MGHNEIVDFFKKNRQVIKQSPFAFLTFFLIAGSISFFSVKWIYDNQINALKEQIAAKDERIKAKDDLIDEYRQRLKIFEGTQSIFQLMTNKELKDFTIKKVNEFRNFLENYRSQEMSLLLSRHQIADANALEMKFLVLSRQFINEYQRKYQIDFVVLKNEILQRLPQNNLTPYDERVFEYPVNPLGAEAAANILETLAKNLPK